ncbi:MAG: hypothetical protein GF317_23250 [Candidatus Lokiarchaeota archaeon]|nr:hypothetical protein [Candidatus Lokiarchaeota archaeon]
MKWKNGDYEFRLYAYEIDELEEQLANMVNCFNHWEIVKIFEPNNGKIMVLYKYKYVK